MSATFGYSYAFQTQDQGGHSTVQKESSLTARNPWKRVLVYSVFLVLQGWLILTLAVAEKYFVAHAKEPKTVSPVVLGAMSTNPTPAPTDVPLPSPTPTIEPTPTLSKTPKRSKVKPQPARDHYTIAVVGDSFVDTMGERLEYLEHALKARYPNTSFTLYNYGVGSENAEDVLERFHEPLKYQDRDYKKIDDVKPDIIVVGSTGYNVFSPYFLDRHWLALTHLVQEAQKLTPNVYMLAEIAPLREEFTRAPGGPNYDMETAVRASGEVAEQVQNAIRLSPVLDVPVIDAYTPSLASSKPEGKREYVNTNDNLHPSVAGHEFMANIIADTISLP